MAWETRTRGGCYYTRSRKAGGRVGREYVGAGRVAELAAETDAIEREKRLRHASALRQEKAELAALDAVLKVLAERTELVARAALLAAGFHRHKRGEWRRRREQPDQAH